MGSRTRRVGGRRSAGKYGERDAGLGSFVPAFKHGAFEHHVNGAGAAMTWQTGGEAEHLRMLAQPGVDMALDQRPLAVEPSGLAMGHANAAHFESCRFGDEVPQQLPGFLDAHAMQVETSVEWDLAGL